MKRGLLFKRLAASRRCTTAIRFMSSNDSGGLFSKDIAYKPAEGGWGAGKKYTSNYDNIFGSKKKEKEDNSETPKVDNVPKENSSS